MKVFILTVLAALILSSAVLGGGLEWSVYIDPSNFWFDPGDMDLNLVVNKPLVIEIRVRNPEGLSVMG